MANWNNPLLTSLYVDFLNEVKARDVDAITMNPGTNIPVDSKRWNTTTNTFQNWNGSAWVNLVLASAGGGTGSTSPTNFGTMAFQNSNAVAITGGTISGVALNADAITAGVLALNRGGTGASLALGGAGAFLQSNGGQVVFGVNGAALTGLNAGAITSGRLPMGQMPIGGDWDISAVGWFRVGGCFIAGAGLGNMGPGTVNASAYYLNNAPFTPGGGAVIPAGLMAYFSGACPSGWTFVAASSGRVVKSSPGSSGQTGGAATHAHGFDVPAGGGGNVNSGGPNNSRTQEEELPGFSAGVDSGSSFVPWNLHGATAPAHGRHSHDMQHFHQFDVAGFPGHSGATGEADSWPHFIEYNLCRKD